MPINSNTLSELITNDLPAKIDEKAKEELKDLQSKSRRSRRESNATHWAFLVLLWIGTIGVSFIIIIKIFHLLGSPAYCWLDESHMKKIDEFLTSGTIGGALTAGLKSKFKVGGS